MLEKFGLEKLFERVPLTIIVMGVLVIVIGASGGLPIGNPPLQVADINWRIALAVFGIILVAFGSFLIYIEVRKTGVEKKSNSGKSFFIKTYPRSQHPDFFSEVEKVVPKAINIVLIATGLNLIWEKRIVDILIKRAKSGKAKITICMGNPFSPHVLDRLVEEEMLGESAPVGRTGIERNVKALMQRLESEGNPKNFDVRLFENYPTFATLIFDKEIFIYPYAYQLLGNECPILHFHNDGSEQAQFFTTNADRIIHDAVPAKVVIRGHSDRKYYSDGWIAAAVYILPDKGSQLYEFGSSIIGYDIFGQSPIDAKNSNIFNIRPYVGDAVQFGFHATIADTLYFINHAEILRIKSELRMIAEDFSPFQLDGFSLFDRTEKVGDIILKCEDPSGVLEALHFEMVSRLYGSSISSNYRQNRTNKKYPYPLERASLMVKRYGSPYILSQFTPHFTLCSSPPSDGKKLSEIIHAISEELEKIQPMKSVDIDEIYLLIKKHDDPYWVIDEKYCLMKK